MKTKVLLVMTILAMFYAGCQNKKTDATAKQADTVLTSIVPDNPTMMIVAKVSIKADKISNFTEAAKEIIELSNKEAGCKFYQLYQDPYDNTNFVFVEQYDNQAAVDAHFASEYFKGFGPKIADFVTGPAQIKIVTVAKEVNQ